MAREAQRRGAHGRVQGALAVRLVAAVLAVWLVAAVLAAVGVAPRAQAPPVPSAAPGGPVVVVGVPGLTWDVVDPDRTPAILDLAADGGAAALVLRGTHEQTCPADAWLTLGAGQRAATDVEGCVDAEFDGGPTADRPAPVLAEDVVVPQGEGALVDQGVWERWSREAERRALATGLGTLAEQVGADGSCVAAYDPLAALGAADPDGRVASYRPGDGTRGRTVPGSGEGTTLPTDLDPGCAVHLMTTVPVGSHGTGGEEATPGPSGPTGTSSSIDTALGTFVDELPDGTTVLLAGLGHVEGRAGATLLVVHPVGAVAAGTGGPGSQGDSTGAALTSGSTQQRSLVQLTDLTATLLQLVGAGGPLPEAVAGQPVVAVGDGPDTGHLEDARDLAAGITLAKVAAPWVLGTVAAVHLALLVLSIARRRQRASAPPGRTGGLSVVATAVLAIPVATFLTGLVPWWGFVRPVAALSLGVLVAVGLVTAVAWAGPWRRQPLGPAAVVAAITLAVVGADVICSARLGLVSVLGLQPVTAGRFYGQGNVGFGIVLGSFLVLAAAVIGDRPAARPAARPATGPADGPEVSRPAAAGAILLLGAAAVLLNAAPQAGADFGGVPALVVATGLMALAALGIRWSAGALALLGLAGVVVAAGVMLLDWTRGPGRRTHLGDFVQRVVDGTALQVVTRKLEQSLGILLSYPLSWLAVLALVLLALAVWRRPAGWTAPLWRHEGMHRALLAGVVATTLGWVLNDSGIAVVALALTVLLAAALSLIGSEPPRTDDGPAPGGLQLVPGAVAPERPGDGPPSADDPRRDG